MDNVRSAPKQAVKNGFALAVAILLFAGKQGAQQKFDDPFSKTGFQAGDLYSSLGNSSIDAVTGRVIYTVPLNSVPRNGKLPQGLSLIYNSAHSAYTLRSLNGYLGLLSIPQVTNHLVDNHTSTIAHGWRLSLGTLILGSNEADIFMPISGLQNGLVFIDSTGTQHRLRHTNGCPPDTCPTNSTGYNEMQPDLFRSADGEFYWAKVTHTGAKITADSITQVEVRSADGLAYIFNEFHPTPERNPLLAAFIAKPIKIGEVKVIKDLDNNQLTMTYDLGGDGTGWRLKSINDGIRPITLDWSYNSFADKTLTELRQLGYLKSCVEGGQPDMRSCRSATPPSHCRPSGSFTEANPGGDDPPDIEPGPVPAQTFSGSFLNNVTIRHAGEQGKINIYTETQDLCRTVIDDHFVSTPNIPPFATVIKRVELNQTIATLGESYPVAKAAYNFIYLPSGMLWKVRNPLGSEEEFRWRSYEPIHWDDIDESCEIFGTPQTTSLIGPPITPNSFFVCVTEFHVNPPSSSDPGRIIPSTSCSFGGGAAAPGPGNDNGGFGGGGGGGGYGGETGFCSRGVQTRQLRCEHYDFANPLFDPKPGYSRPSSCGPIPAYNRTETGYLTAEDDPNCQCRNYVIEHAQFDSSCNTLGGVMHGSSYGVHDRILRDANGNTYQWRYDRLFDDSYNNRSFGTSRSDTFTAPEPNNGRSFQDRRFVEITNPDHTVERLYFYESSNYVCSLGAQANKQGQPSAREVLDLHGNVIMREEYEYMGFPMPGSVRHTFQRGGGNSPLGHSTPFWNLARLHADFFRIATTTKYYKPHFKPSLLASDSLKTNSIVFSDNDDFRALHWNPQLAGVNDRSGFIDLSPSIAEPLVNGSYDDQYLLYAHRSEQSNYLELGHFGKTQECDVQEITDNYFDVVSRLTTHLYSYKCADEIVLPIDVPGHTRTVRPLPGIGMDNRRSRTWWNAEKNPTLNLDREKWTIHQPVQEFMIDAGGKAFSASLSRYSNGKLEQMRGLDLPRSTCTIDESRFPHSNVYDFTTPQPSVPSDVLLNNCQSRTPNRDHIDRRSYDTSGNLNRQEIALGSQALFNNNGTGTISNPFALNYSWDYGQPVSSQFDGFTYKNQERTVYATSGLVHSERDPNYKSTAFSYDNLMRVTSITPPDGEAASTINYPTMNDAELSKGDTQLNYHYDGLGRIWKADIKMPDGSLVHKYTGYDFAGRKAFLGEWTIDANLNPNSSWFQCVTPVGVTVPTGKNIINPVNPTQFSGTYTCFDALGRPERVIAADGATTEFYYLGVDSVVRVFKNKKPNGHPDVSPDDQVMKYFHDAFGRLIMVDTDCRVKSLIDTSPDYLVCEKKNSTDPNIRGQGADAIYFYDVAGRLVFVNLVPQLPENPRPAYIACELNPESCLPSSPFGLGQVRKFSYDSLGRLQSANNPENGRVDYLAYDALGNVLEVQDDKGRATVQTISTLESYDPCDNTWSPPIINSFTVTANPAQMACADTTLSQCYPSGTSPITINWNVTGAGLRCMATSYQLNLIGPGPTASSLHLSFACADTVNSSGTVTRFCNTTSFSLTNGGGVADGRYTVNFIASGAGGSSNRSVSFGINPLPAAIHITSGPSGDVTGPQAEVAYASVSAPADSYVQAEVNPVPAGFNPALHLPSSGTLRIDGLFGQPQNYSVTLLLKAANGEQISQDSTTFRVNRIGTYALRYSYDRRGRLTAVNKLNLATGGGLTPLTEIGYDNYTRLGDFHTDLSSNAPLGKKTWSIGHARGAFSFINATDYTSMGGRTGSQTLTVNDGVNPRTFTASTNYNDLGIPASLVYPSFVGGALTSSNVYTAGYLQGQSGNTTDNNVQRNYLSNLTFNPAGTLANFNLGNGAQTIMTYDNRNRPLTIINNLPGTSFTSGNYAYDGAGNICNIGSMTLLKDQNQIPIPGNYDCDTNGQTFGYDRLNRLTDAHITRTLASGGAPFGTQDFHYEYDLFSNMTKKFSPMGGANTLANPSDLSNPFIGLLTFGTTTPRMYNAGSPVSVSGDPLPEYSITNRIDEAGFTFDPNGNLTQDTTNCYAYDELNRMTSATPKISGVCATDPIANYFYDADNLRIVKQSIGGRDSNGNLIVTKYVTSVRGGLDALTDITTHVADGQEATQPFEQKNYIYGPGGLVASERRTLFRSGSPPWQLYGQSTGCSAPDSPAVAQNLRSSGWDAAFDFGMCTSSTVKTMTLEWHELNDDGTPKNCTNQQTDTTTNFNARYHCGLLHIDPAIATTLLQKLKYGTSYSAKVTVHADLGLLGERDFVTADFIVKLGRGATTDQLAYVSNLSSATQQATAPPPDPNIPAPGPGGRFVEYYQKDHLGTIRVVSNESGIVESTHDYEPFGLELPGQDASSNTHRFTGHERDFDTGLDYMKARYYGAGMGRFNSSDYIAAQLTKSKTWNRYTYSANNPIKYYDPDGHLEMDKNNNPTMKNGRVDAVIHSKGDTTRYWVYIGYVTTDKGNPVQVITVDRYYSKDARVGDIEKLNPETGKWEISSHDNSSANPMGVNCHGYTVGNGMMTIHNNDMPTIVSEDGYKKVAEGMATTGMLALYTDPGDPSKVVHSSLTETFDKDNNAVTVCTEGGVAMTEPEEKPIGPGPGTSWPNPADVNILTKDPTRQAPPPVTPPKIEPTEKKE